MNREQAGQIVRSVWVDYCKETGHVQSADHIAPWEELNEWGKEVDRRIGEAVARAAIAEAESIARATKTPTAQLIADVIADLVAPAQQEAFADAVRADPDMTPEQKAKWLDLS